MATVPEMSGAPDKNYNGEPVVAVDGGEGRCTECRRYLGTIVNGRNLRMGEGILVNRTPIRCGSCGTRQYWLPLSA